jgi:hypothetical protein
MKTQTAKNTVARHNKAKQLNGKPPEKVSTKRTSDTLRYSYSY